MAKLSDKEIMSKNIVSKVVEAYQTLYPFNGFLNEALG